MGFIFSLSAATTSMTNLGMDPFIYQLFYCELPSGKRLHSELENYHAING